MILITGDTCNDDIDYKLEEHDAAVIQSEDDLSSSEDSTKAESLLMAKQNKHHAMIDHPSVLGIQ